MADNAFENVAVIGAGTMGHGIAQVAAMAGMEIMLFDLTEEALLAGLDRIHGNLDKGVDRGKVTEAEREQTLERIAGTTDLALALQGLPLSLQRLPLASQLCCSLARSCATKPTRRATTPASAG